MDREMIRALEADGEKLRQLTGEDCGPVFIFGGQEMTKEAALKLIDEHKNKLVNPVEMLAWTWLRVIILQISDDSWEVYLGEATEVLSR